MNGCYAFLMSTVSAAVKVSTGLDSMADNFALTMMAFWRQGMNRAFKAVEIM